MTKKLDVIAAIRCKPNREAEVLAAVEECIAPSRAEAGCDKYDFFADMDVQGRFVFIETWADKAALDHHMTLPHFNRLVEKLTPLIDGGFEVQTLEHIY